jgi:Lipocalin-like domain
MRRLLTAATAFLVGAFVTGHASAQTAQPPGTRLLGTWRLVGFQSDSFTVAARGARPTGLLIYDATGHMAVQIQPDRRRASWPQSQAPTPEQALDAVRGYTAYFGTYSVDERAHTITHHRDGALNLDFVDYVRRYEFDPNGRLILLPVDRPQSRLVWERVK